MDGLTGILGSYWNVDLRLLSSNRRPEDELIRCYPESMSPDWLIDRWTLGEMRSDCSEERDWLTGSGLQ